MAFYNKKVYASTIFQKAILSNDLMLHSANSRLLLHTQSPAKQEGL